MLLNRIAVRLAAKMIVLAVLLSFRLLSETKSGFQYLAAMTVRSQAKENRNSVFEKDNKFF